MIVALVELLLSSKSWFNKRLKTTNQKRLLNFEIQFITEAKNFVDYPNPNRILGSEVIFSC